MVAVFRGNFLTFWRVEIFQVGFRHLFSTFFLSTTLSTTDTVGSARIELTRRDDFEFIFPQFIRCQQSFVFPGNQYIANSALDKSVSGATRAKIQNFDVFIQCPNKILCFCLIVVVVMQRVAPGCQVVPARATRAFRIRRYYRNTRFNQIVPVMDLLCISLIRTRKTMVEVYGAELSGRRFH